MAGIEVIEPLKIGVIYNGTEVGAAGRGIVSITKNLDNTATIIFTDATTQDIDLPVGDDGVGISSIALFSSEGYTDTYRITFTDSSTFDYEIENGLNGADGADGDNGASIISGAFVGNDLVLTKDDASTVTITDALLDLKGDTGANGADGTNGTDGNDGLNGADGNGITGIALHETVGLVKTYRITFDDATIFDFDVTDGTDGEGGAGAVSSVNTQTGEVVLDADDISDTSTTNKFTNATEKSKLSGIAEGAEVNVNADWNSASGDSQILNKPTIPTALSDLSEDITHRVVTDTEKSTWNGKQDALGFTAENVSNKVTAFQVTPDNTAYPTEKLVKDSLDGKQASGSYEVTSNKKTTLTDSDDNYPTTKAVNTGLSGKSNTDHNHTGVYEPAFSKNTAFNKTFGTGATDVTVGNDSRLSDARTPTTHDNTKHSATYITASGVTKANLATNGDIETSLTSVDTKIPTSKAVIDYVAANGGATFWTTVAGTPVRIGNTSFRITGDYTAILARKTVLKWTDTTTHCGMIVSSSYSSPNTTITIIGDVLSATATMNTFKYASQEPTTINFAVAGTIGAVASDVANAYYADEPYRVIGADLNAGTAGTTNSTTIDINKAGSTMFTTKPTLASTSAIGVGFTANDDVSLALSDKVTIDIDAVQTTKAVDLYVKLFLFPTKFLSLT